MLQLDYLFVETDPQYLSDVIKELNYIAFIMVKYGNFTYSDLMSMTVIEFKNMFDIVMEAKRLEEEEMRNAERKSNVRY